MKKSVLMVLAGAMVLLSMTSGAGAWGTSPYLLGNWEDDGWEYVTTNFIITNPLPVPVDVYAYFYDNAGNLFYCLHNTLLPVARWDMNTYYDLDLYEGGYAGVAQFAAFPYSKSGARVVNENTAITGYQTRWIWDEVYTETQAPLNAMIFNTLTKTQMSNLAKIGPCYEWEGGGEGLKSKLKSTLKNGK